MVFIGWKRLHFGVFFLAWNVQDYYTLYAFFVLLHKKEYFMRKKAKVTNSTIFFACTLAVLSQKKAHKGSRFEVTTGILYVCRCISTWF